MYQLARMIFGNYLHLYMIKVIKIPEQNNRYEHMFIISLPKSYIYGTSCKSEKSFFETKD